MSSKSNENRYRSRRKRHIKLKVQIMSYEKRDWHTVDTQASGSKALAACFSPAPAHHSEDCNL